MAETIVVARAGVPGFTEPRARPDLATRIALIGGFTPRRCGIATFTADIHASLIAASPKLDIDVYALTPEPGNTRFDAGVRGMIVAGDPASYVAASLIVTLHTVIPDPDPDQRRVMLRLVARASNLIVMSQRSRCLLASVCGADAGQIEFIPHGVPDRPFGRSGLFKAKLGFTGTQLLLTFGLLSPGKDILAAMA